MTMVRFAKNLSAYTKHFIEHNNDHPDVKNIRQYADFNRVYDLLKQYARIISDIKQQGATSIIDVGSGVGFAKCIDPNITTANMDVDYFFKVEEVLNVVSDISLFDCTITEKWVNTTHKFDCAILYRFMPWAGKILDNQTIVKVFTEMSRILKPNGVLIYTPINADQFLDRNWSQIPNKFRTFKLSQSDIQHELDKAKNEILQYSSTTIDHSSY
jgi:SAM-dependent methyltransferase